LVECVFDVFDGGTLALEDLNGVIEITNVGIESLDVLFVMDVVENQVIEFLGMGVGHLGRGKNGQVVLH
jgi:hypothetical protein